MCCHFSRTTLFLEKLLLHTFSEWLLRHNSYIFGAAIFPEQLLLSPFSEQSSAIFRITYFFWRAAFLERLLFQKTIPLIAATFSEELLFYNTLFQKNYYFTATLLFTAALLIYSLVIKWTVLSCASIIAQNCIIDGYRKLVGQTKYCGTTTLWWNYFLTELLFQNLFELLFQKMLFFRTANFRLLTLFSQLYFLFII